MEQTLTWHERIKMENETKAALCQQKLDAVLEAIKDQLLARNMWAYTQRRFDESNQLDPEIKIGSHIWPGLKIGIYYDTYISKARMYCGSDVVIDGQRYNLIYQLNRTEQESIGIKDRAIITPDFKPDKNPKLVCKDVIPVLDTCLKLWELAQPKALAEHKRKQTLLEFCQKLEDRTRYPQQLKLDWINKRTPYRIESIGEFVVDPDGSITLTQRVDQDEALKLLGSIEC
jgi:hypothetical protein